MKTTSLLRLIALVALIGAGCSSLPGLRVLTGEDGGEAAVNRAVETLDLVVADKTGATNPSLLSAADRIEAATGNVDVIEIRPDPLNDTFIVNMLYAPPEAPDTLEGQFMQLDDQRRAIELTWQAVLTESQGLDSIRINLVAPQNISTLDSGPSFIGLVYVNADISRTDAASYLSGERNLNNFYGLIVNGRLNYRIPESASLYAGRPNHPTFMLQLMQQQSQS